MVGSVAASMSVAGATSSPAAQSAKKKCKKAKGAVAAKKKKKCKKKSPAAPSPVTLPAPANLSIDPTAHDYGNQATPTTKVFTVTNTGASPSGEIGFSISGPDASEFTFNKGGTTCGVALGAGLSCTLDVEYAAFAAGDRSATLNVNASPGGVLAVPLSGFGV
jgi:hypothetical protein